MMVIETPWDSISKKEGKLNTRAVEGDSAGTWFWVRYSNSSFGVAYRYEKSRGPVEGYFKATSEISFINVPESQEREHLCILIDSSELGIIFKHLCVDLMAACNDINDPSKVFPLISNRVKSWQKLFRRGTKKLNTNQVVGLMVELRFLTDFWLSISTNGIEGWVGPLDFPQDFLDQDNDFAVELKAFSPDRKNVQISSLEQLDFDGTLFLATYPIKQSGEDGSYTLNEFVEVCRSLLPSAAIPIFNGKLIEAGYVEDPCYGEDSYLIEDINIFEVREGFPCLRKSTIELAISKAKYELELNCLSSFKVTQEQMIQEAPRG